jgi:hypothetical protein
MLIWKLYNWHCLTASVCTPCFRIPLLYLSRHTQCNSLIMSYQRITEAFTKQYIVSFNYCCYSVNAHLQFPILLHDHRLRKHDIPAYMWFRDSKDVPNAFRSCYRFLKELFIRLCRRTLYIYNKQTNSVAWVREGTIQTERPPLVGEVSDNIGW